jgi:hypothetical protein
MVSDKFKQLADYQQKVAALQKKIERERVTALASLHQKYGFGSPAELIRAIRAASGPAAGKRAGRPGGGHRKYARISPELRQKIKAALQAGKTGGQVAAAFGISVPSVYNIKKASGLVKARKAK